MKKFRKWLPVLMVLLLGLSMNMISCSDVSGGGESPMIPGSYTETAIGYLKDSEYEVTVVVDEYNIRNIFTTAKNTDNSSQVGAHAIPIMIERVLEDQTVSVDSVSGATITSTFFRDAVERALDQAKAPARMYDTLNRNPIDLTIDCEVLVIGAGIAGLSAAKSAKIANPDKTVVLIDMSDLFGGSSRMCGSVIGMSVSGSSTDKNDMANWFQARAQGDDDLALLRRWADQSIYAFKTLTGRTLNETLPNDGRNQQLWPGKWSRYYFGSDSGVGMEGGPVNEGGMWVDSMARMVKNAGVIFMTNVRGTELIADGQKVAGAKAEDYRKKISYTFNTSKGVIICTGAIGWDEELMAEYYPGIKGVGPYTQQGDHVRMAKQVNADLLFKGGGSVRGLAYGDATRTDGFYAKPIITNKGEWPGDDGLKYTYGHIQDTMTAVQAKAANYMGYEPKNGLQALTFDAPGAIRGEDYDYNRYDGILCPCDVPSCNTPNGPGCAINQKIRVQMQSRFIQDQLAKKDDTIKFYYLDRKTPAALNSYSVFSGGIGFASAREGYNYWLGDNPAELAAAINEPGITAQILTEAYDGMMIPTVAAADPSLIYCVIRIEPIANILNGGIMIDIDGRALRNGNPIEGLYAAGECASGQFFYLDYPTSGAGLSLGMTFGYLAGYHAMTGLSKPEINFAWD
jgi:uncharacterized protein with FMN-binding domain